jgi:hypothetical protein
MILASIHFEDIWELERIFAVLTPEGWAIPVWLCNLRDRKEYTMR